MGNNIFKGLGIALITPFKENGEIDFASLKQLIEHQIANHTDYFCILATTGETPCLSTDEKEAIKHFVVNEVAGRCPILMGCGGNCTNAIVEEIQKGDFRGVDGILSVCPSYNKPTQEGLYQHFSAIAKATDLPIVMYNVPGRTGVNMLAETTLRLAQDHKNIVAVKEACGNLVQIENILSKKPNDFDVISGDDALTFPLILSGAVGVISVLGNAFPHHISNMIKSINTGNISQARAIHHSFKDLYSLLFVEGNPAGIKVLLHEMGLCKNVLRLPLVPVSHSTQELITSAWKKIDK